MGVARLKVDEDRQKSEAREAEETRMEAEKEVRCKAEDDRLEAEEEACQRTTEDAELVSKIGAVTCNSEA